MDRKKFNLKYKVIIKIFYTQTHQLCTYNFILGNPFSVFVHETMKTCLMHILFSLYASLGTTNVVLKTMSSQDSYHNYNSSRDSTIVRVRKSRDDTMICIMNLVTHVSHYSCVPWLLCIQALVRFHSHSTHGLSK